jgi:crotonobetaine/carnitine-CoA ligase
MASWPDAVTFADAWERAVLSHGHRPFLIFERPSGEVTEWTYAEFDEVVARVAAGLAARGVATGSAVHLALMNSPWFVAMWLACTRLGAWMVPSDPLGKTPELAGHISRTHPVVGVCAMSRADVYRPASGGIDVIEIDEADIELRALDTPSGGRAVGRSEISLRSRLAVMFTSGTTGVPKGVEVTQANYAFAGMVMAGAAGLESHHRQIVVLPVFHANAQYYSFASAIWAGASVALMPMFSARQFLHQCVRHRATHASLFAAPMRMILAHGTETAPAGGAGLTHCWYAMNITDEQHATFTHLLGCAPRQLYGMTETLPAVLTDERDRPVPSSMGFVTDHCEVAVQDSAGRSCGPGEVGEIVVRGESGVTLFSGYLDMPDVTTASFRNGWFLTGDRARRDADGRYFFDGRRSDVLKVSGENVSIVEVESVISQHPKVLEVAVVGRADAIRDEVPVAYVVARDPNDPPRSDELDAWCTDRLAKAKRPRDFILLPELPRTSVGKIRKFMLRDPVEGISA